MLHRNKLIETKRTEKRPCGCHSQWLFFIFVTGLIRTRTKILKVCLYAKKLPFRPIDAIGLFLNTYTLK